MSEQEDRQETNTITLPFSFDPAELKAIGKKRIKELTDAQSEFFETVQESNRQWLDRIESETNLASEFVSQLISARSVPEVVNVCREWMARHLEMAAEDGKLLLAEMQKYLAAGARMSNGWSSDQVGAST